MKTATVYERNGKLYIHSLSKTTVGVWVINPPVLTASKSNAGEIGRAIRECLAGSREGVPHPSPSVAKRVFDPVLNLAGVKSTKEFNESAKCVQVEAAEGKSVTFVPTRNGRAERGFTRLSNPLEIAPDSDDALGSATLIALERSE